jgi:hypothetical protein
MANVVYQDGGVRLIDDEVIAHMNQIVGGGIAIGGRTYTFADLNRLINRLDVEKDAKAGTNGVPAKVNPYYSTVDSLFGNNATSFSVRLHEIEKEIFKERFGHVPVKIPWLTKPGTTYSVLPSNIKYGYHDSGYDPKDVMSNIELNITSGSYIDPAKRDSSVQIFPLNNPVRLTSKIMLELGFPEGMNIVTNINSLDRNCTMRIGKIPFVLDESRDNKFKHISPGPDYFRGNNEKNAVIGTSSTTPDEVTKYVICKELGDLLQCVYAMVRILIINKTLGGNNFLDHCIFTADNVVAARARTMGIPACVQDLSKKLSKNIHCVYFYEPISSEADRERISKQTSWEACLNNNTMVKNAINSALFTGLRIGASQEILVNSAIRNLMAQITESIDVATELARQSLTDTSVSADDYKKLTVKCTALSVVANKKGSIPLSVKRIFIAGVPSSVVDVIANNREPLYVTVQRLEKQKGGAATALRYRMPATVIRKKSVRPLNGMTRKNRVIANIKARYSIHPRASVAADPATFLKEASQRNELRTQLYSSMIKAGIKATECEDWLYTVYNYFIYIGETPLHPGYFRHLVEIGFSTDVTLEQFEEDYKAYFSDSAVMAIIQSGIMTILTDDEKNELLFTPDESNNNYSLLSPFESATAPAANNRMKGGRRKTVKRRKHPRRRH